MSPFISGSDLSHLPALRYNIRMNTIRRATPVVQLLLILPAAFFMVSLIVRGRVPAQYEPAHTAQQVVLWYSGRIWTLWILLALLPLAVFSIGCMALVSQWAGGTARSQILTNGTTVFITVLTLASAVILLIVGVHVLMN